MPIENRSDENLRKNIRFYCGSSGAGKSHQIKEYIRTVVDRAAIFIFDPEEEYSKLKGVQSFESLREFARAVFSARAANSGGAFAYVGEGAKEFDAFCSVVWSVRGADYPLLVVVDELAGVTQAGKARGYWHRLTTRGRKYGIHICAGAQSPAEIDKTIMRQQNYIYIGYLERPADHEYIGSQTRITREQVEKLRPDPYFDHWEIEAGNDPEFGTAEAA